MSRRARLRRGVLAGVVAAAAAAGCGDTQLDSTTVRSFDRPVDLAFGCFGRLRILGANGVSDPDDPIEFSAQPLGSCVTRTLAVAPGNAPEHQEDSPIIPIAATMQWLQIAVQPTSGTITVVTNPEGGLNPSPALSQDAYDINDGDPLTPGHNAIAVGSLPIAIATDTAGCHALTANAGSCDLSVIDLTRLANGSTEPLVRSLPVLAGGQPLLARPAAMASVDLASPIGLACARPAGLVYVAYPDCHAVAAIDADTGAVVSSIRFAADGTPSIDASGALTCPRQCGARDVIVDGARPVTLDLVRDDTRGHTQRLAIGLDNRPVVTVVTLDGAGLPTTVDAVELDGDVGVVDVALSKQIKMGGDNLGLFKGNNDVGDESGPGVDAQFVYAVATDATVRVAEVLVANQECDAQVDPRFLYDNRDLGRLVCMGVGQPGTPPRRAGARSPGIELPGQARPVAVTIASVDNGLPRSSTAEPAALAGHFAFIALSNGFTAVANVDDDNYPDTYRSNLELGSVVALGMPHQLRDAVKTRDVDNVTTANNEVVRTCQPGLPIDADGVPVGGPHAVAAPERIFGSAIASAKSFALPTGHQTLCVGDDATVPVSDLTFAAPLEVRERTFPDWRGLPVDETWSVAWEGSLSLDGSELVLDGPSIRSGLVDIAGGGIRVVDSSRPFCAAGVETHDLVTLRGCDPARGDAQCGAGETCYVHPDATVATGACLATDQLDALAGSCRDYLISQRRYSVFEAYAGELRLHERWRELRSTPVSGCTSDSQCQDLAKVEAKLTSPLHPKDEPAPDPDAVAPYTYACQADSTRAPGPNRCVMTCAMDSQCEAGTLCRGGHCLEGIVPSPECAAGLQRYDLRGGDAFVVVGDRTGYLHSMIEETGSGRCVKDPTGNPLVTGRIPLTAPPCTGDGVGDLSPNPCSQTVDQVERVPDYVPGGSCALATTGGTIRTRAATAIRFSNPGMRFSLVDPTYPGDATCLQDRAGGLGDIPTVFAGLQLRFRVVAGFSVFVAGARVVQPSNVVRAPDGAVWVLDAGDIDDSSSGTPNLFGQLIRIDPDTPLGGFVFR